MTDAPIIGTACTYEDLLAQLREQKERLGFSCREIDAAIGWADGYAGKVFGPGHSRRLGPDSLGLLLTLLGLRIVLVADREPIRPALPKKHSQDHGWWSRQENLTAAGANVDHAL